MPEGLKSGQDKIQMQGDFENIYEIQDEIRAAHENNEGKEAFDRFEPTPIVDDHEHVVDVKDEQVMKEIEKAKNLFSEFYAEFTEKFDLGDLLSIDTVLEAAKNRGVFQVAEEIRNLIYDNNISIYGVSYLSNVCGENCTFCPQGVCNWKIWQLEQEKNNNPNLTPDEKSEMRAQIDEYESQLKTLSPEEAKQDYAALAEIGHEEICILSGEKIAANPGDVIDYTQIALNTPGIKEVILNLGVYSAKIFRMIRENLVVPPGKRLQYRVFQETYDSEEYSRFTQHADKSGTVDMPGKAFFIERHMSQGEALKAGFDEVGIGALFGLTKYPLKEIWKLQEHAGIINRLHGKEPKRCCLPFGNEPENIHVDIPYMVSKLPRTEEITELIYALARLSMPTVSIVSSERDEPELLKRLDKYANHTTLFVHPGPGRNIESLKELDSTEKTKSNVVEQAKTTSRQPRDAILDWFRRGYRVVDFDWKKYVSNKDLEEISKE